MDLSDNEIETKCNELLEKLNLQNDANKLVGSLTAWLETKAGI